MTDEIKEAGQAAVAGICSPHVFWKALQDRRVALQSSSNVVLQQTRLQQTRKTLSQLHDEARSLKLRADENLGKVSKLESARKVAALGCVPTSRCCSLFAAGSCPFEHGSCPRGSHEVPNVPEKRSVFVNITKAKLRLIQQKWTEAGGCGELQGAWQIRNPRLEFLFRGAEANFLEEHSRTSDVIDAWHGSAEENVFSIAQNGFEPSRRSGQVYGAGEYFAKDPNVSMAYARGGSFMFLCKLLLGEDAKDHTWHAGPKYYVIKQREGRMQVLPIFLLQFKATGPRSP